MRGLPDRLRYCVETPRPRWGAALLVLLALACVPAVAAQDDEPPVGLRASDLVGIRELDKPLGPLASPEAWAKARREIEELRRREAERRERLQGPAAREERATSRSAHLGLSDDEASRLLQRTFGPRLEAGRSDAQAIARGRDIVEFLDDHTMRVRGRDGETRIVQAQGPLRVRDADTGEQKPVDFTLGRAGDWFAPRVSATDLAIAASLADGARVASIQVRPDGAAAGTLVDERSVAYPNALLDTDVVLQPTSLGLESFHQLRSPRSPEELAFAFELPTGAALRQAAGGGAEVVDGEKRLLWVAPPSAVDAQGEPVDVTTEVVGERLIVRVPHRDKDVAYPVLVDPVFQNWATDGSGAWTRTWALGYHLDWLDANWFWDGNAYTGTKWCTDVACYSGRPPNLSDGLQPQDYDGLHVWAGPGSYGAGTDLSGGWIYVPPGDTTQIARVDYIYDFTRRSSAAEPTMFVDVWSESALAFAGLKNYTVGNLYVQDGFTTNGAAGPHTLGFGLWDVGGGTTLSNWRDAAIRGMVLELTDPEPPTIGSWGLSGPTWWTRHGGWSVVPTVSDPGLGVRRLKLSVPLADGTTATHEDVDPCTGTSEAPCWDVWNGFLLAGFDGDDGSTAAGAQAVAEGITSLTLEAWDAGGRTSSASTSVKLDRTEPTLVLTDTSGQALNPATTYTLQPGQTFTIRSSSTDGSVAQPRAGIAAFEVEIDGVRETTQTFGCSSSVQCQYSQQWDWTFNPATQGGGERKINVIARDAAGNRERSATLTVVAPTVGDVLRPAANDGTSRRLVLEAEANNSAFTEVKFRYRCRQDTGLWSTWADIPVAHLTTEDGTAIGAALRPLESDRRNQPLVWDVRATTPALGLNYLPPLCQVLAQFSGGGGGISKPTSFSLDSSGIATDNEYAPVGPGEVDLLTGNFRHTATDVTVGAFGGGLSLSRSYNSRRASLSDQGPFGPGWASGVAVAGGMADYERLTALDGGERAELTTSGADKLYFGRQPDGSYVPEPGVEGLSLTRDEAQDLFVLRDIDGATTNFTRVSGAGDDFYSPTQVQIPGTNGSIAASNTIVHELGPNSAPRVKRVIAPAPSSVGNCDVASPPRGCRVLDFVYAQQSTPGLSDSVWGDHAGRMKEVRLTAYDPATAGVTTTAVAAYQYDSSGRLRAAWDPRLPNLKTTYSYSSAKLSAITPPGQQSWTFTYAAGSGDTGNSEGDTAGNRLQTATRGNAVTTIAYNLALTRSAGGPYDMAAQDVGLWSQQQFPTSAAAVVPPHPSTGMSSTALADIRRGSVHYLGPDGRTLNVVAPDTNPTDGGGHTSSSEYDVKGNVVATLTPANRERALLSPGAGEADRKYYTLSSYSADGLELREEWGPEHELKLDDGSLLNGRRHTSYEYECNGVTPAAHLVSKTTVAAVAAKTTPPSPDMDARVTRTVNDCSLRLPTETNVDPDNGAGPPELALVRKTVYNSYGLPIKSTMPSNPAGTDASAGETIYYSAGANAAHPECGNHAEWWNLPCKTKPVAQPSGSGLPQLPITTVEYNRLHQVTKETEQVGTIRRITTTSYDTAGRKTGDELSTTGGTRGLVAAYGLEEGAGTTVADASGKGNNGTVNGATWTTAGHDGKALDFDGTNDTVTIPSTPSLSPTGGLTLAGWVRPAALPANFGTATIARKEGQYLLRLNWAGRFVFRLWKGGQTYELETTAGMVAAGQWKHVAATWDGTTMRIYVDGGEQASQPLSGSIDTTGASLYLGSSYASYDWLSGRLDELRVYDRALTPAQVQADQGTAVSATTGGDPGEPVPAVTYGYDSATGMPTTVSSGGKTVTTAYDFLGRVVAYTDADGNTSSTDYDMLDRPTMRNDGKGSQTLGYNATTGMLTSLQDSHAGTFTAAYDADGNLTSRTYPNEMRADTVYDASGAPTDLTYTKTSNCSSNCVWFEDHVEESIHGQWRTQQSTLSSQAYRYDRAGRLLRVDDTLAGAPCTTARSYAFDANSNRTALTSRATGEGACDTAAEGFGAADEIGVNAGTYRGGAALGKPGALQGDDNTAVALDGTNDTVRVSNAASLSPTSGITLEARVRPAQLPASAATLARKEGQYLLRISSTGQVVFRLWKAGVAQGTQTSAGAVAAGGWYHVAAAWDGTTMRIYVNGTQQASVPLQGPIDTTANTLYLGSSFGTSDWFNGRLDEFALYDRALPQQTVQQHHAAASQSPSTYRADVTTTAGLVSYWRLGEGTTSSKAYSYDVADRLTGTGVAYDPFGRMTDIPSQYAGGGTLQSSYYANDMVQSQTQDGVTKGWLLDPTLQRHRASVPNAGDQEILHYADDSDAPAWTEQVANGATTSWTRNIEGIEGDLAATYDSQTGAATLQLTNLHGDVVATASTSPTATALLATFEADEFGNPRQPSNRRYAWLGGKQRRTEFASGVIQMGVRTYVPAMGRFTSVDPLPGGSANAYDYANQDPLNEYDLDGRCPVCVRVVAELAKVVAKGGRAAKRAKPFARRAGRTLARAGVAASTGKMIVNWIGKTIRHVLSGGRAKISIHRADHDFANGPHAVYRPHLQFNLWEVGAQKSGTVKRFAFGKTYTKSQNSGLDAFIEVGGGKKFEWGWKRYK